MGVQYKNHLTFGSIYSAHDLGSECIYILHIHTDITADIYHPKNALIIPNEIRSLKHHFNKMRNEK